MAFQWSLVGFGPAGIAAAVAITIGMAALSGVFVEDTVDRDDYDDDGIYVPPVVLPNPNQNEDPTVNPNPGENDNPNEDEPGYPTVDPDANPNKDQSLVFPWGFVCVAPSVTPTDDYDPDIPEDIRPPSSDFAVAAEPYDSGAGWIIAALMAFVATFSISVNVMTSIGRAGASDGPYAYHPSDHMDRRRYP